VKARAGRAEALLLIAAAIWGFAFVAQRAGMEHVGPFAYNGVRFALGAATLLPFVLARPRGPREATRPLLAGGAATGIALFAGASLQQAGIVWTTAGKAGFITGLYVVFVPLLGLALGHRPGRRGWAGAALAVAGLGLLSVRADVSLAPGDGLVLASAVCFAVHVLLVARWATRVDPRHLALVQFVVCAAMSLAVAAVTETTRVGDLAAAAGPILYGGIASVGIGYTLQVVAQRRAHPTAAAVLLALESPFAALGGFLLLGETLTGRALAGCGLMLAGVLTCQAGDAAR